MGAPGTGKTIFMKYCRSVFPNYVFMHIQGLDLFKITYDQISIMFKMAEFYSPCVMTFDELDYVAFNWPDKFEMIKQLIS